MTKSWSLLFLLAALGFNLFSSNQSAYLSAEERNFGGPIVSLTDESATIGGSVTYPDDGSQKNSPAEPQAISEDSLIVGISNPLGNVSSDRNGVTTYKIRKDDTLSGIAANFGISIDTIKWANPDLKSTITPGQEITILPVSGILYQVKDGDSVESVLGRYQVDLEAFKTYNSDYQKSFSQNKVVVLPYAEPIKDLGYWNHYSQGLPDLRTYFALPARGWNWGVLHDYNAVDIADACGSPVYASAEGLVIEESDNNYWNNGYGNYVMIEHPNSTKTRYAHLLKSLVTVGDYVSQGDQIALIGNTGNTHGPTGCHLHFEVYGAKNPFAIR